ncbi:phage portal protein [Microbacteriaceae bacterium VKM Ac-2855]|nr:phage portal protein [Microbacteriaceae bacterium VKM Ac-2855]
MRKNGTPFEMKLGIKALPDAIELLPSHLVQFKLGKERFSDSLIKYAQQDYKIGQVIRGYNPDPENPYYGESIISAAASAIDSDQQMQSWNRRTFTNNARPGLIFNLQGENIDPQVYDRLKQQMDELYTAYGALKSLVVENGDVKPYMLTHQDLDFLASREFTRDEILAIFTVSPSMLGMTTDFNRANMDASHYLHILLNVIPRLDDEMAMWNTQLVKEYDPTLELYYESPIPEDVEAKLKEAQAGTNLWRTIDETREEYGLEPLPDDLGAQLVVPINTTTLDRVINAPRTAPAADAAGDDADTDEPVDTKSEGKKSVPKPRQ